MEAPKMSLFTPTNNPKYLLQAYHSLLMQDYQRWEWLILLNGQSGSNQERLADAATLHASFDGDLRVRVELDDTGSDKIGQLKLRAISHCTGDAFIEFDHDDLLVPGVLTKVAAAIANGAGFVYSDSAVFEDDFKTWGYHPSHGWEHYPITVYNKQFVVSKTFPLSPRMLCEVYYAPDHVRVWSRDAYYKAGGHNPKLSVGDDHELICRTYLTGVPFQYLGECGYLYRYHANNTVKKRNQAIQTQQAANRQRYLGALVAEWCRREGHPTINLLKEWREGRWNPKNGASYHAASRDNFYGQIIATDVLQFMPPEDQVRTMNTFYRTLIPGGYVNITVPSSTPTLSTVKNSQGHVVDVKLIPSRYADMNPLHLTRFNSNSFLYYSRREFAQNQPGVTCRFDQIQLHESYPSEDFQKYDMKVMHIDLCALKGQRHPGQDKI